MKRLTLVLTSVPAVALTSLLLSSSNGVTPGITGPADSPRLAPSCTTCHSATFGSSGISVQMTTQHHSLDLGESVTVSLQVSGGPPSGTGGFAAECSDGSFATSQANVQVTNGSRIGQYASHTNFQHRSWQWRFLGPPVPGLSKLYAVGMASNGDGMVTGDALAFHGSDPTATSSTPVYIGVNAAGNRRFGQGCVGGHGIWPVLYSDLSPTVGNQGYGLQLAGAAPGTAAIFVVGYPSIAPIPLDVVGVTGCGLWVNRLAEAIVPTSAGDPTRGEGTASARLPIPNDITLRGLTLAAQVAFVDSMSGRNLPFTLTNGLLISVQ